MSAIVVTELDAWKSASDAERFFIDGPDHGFPAAESAYRESYSAAVRESVTLLISDLTDDSQMLGELLSEAQAERWKVADLASVGEHVPRYRPGHEVDAARARARHQALAQVMQVVSHVDDFNQSVGVLVSWSSTVEAWAANDSRQFSPPPALPIVKPGSRPTHRK